MQNLQNTVGDVVPGDADDAFDTILRFDAYHEWWPKSLSVKCIRQNEDFVGSKVLIKPYPFISVGWKLHSYSPGREIIIHYYRGMHTGVGVWTFADSSEDGVLISFEIDIVPKNWLFALAYRIFNVERSHVKQVKSVIQALAKRIE